MRPDLWRQAEELFHAALERPPEERRAYLDIACGQDTELRRYVELLVSGEENAGSFLDKAGAPDLTATIGIDGSLVGRQFGHYRIVSPLGKGGMGEVYRAHDTKLSRNVALKMLPDQFARDRERVSRFRREARTLASLNHPHVAAIYGLEEFDGVDFLVLELVEGKHPSGPLPVAEVLEIAQQIAEALEAAHARGIIHRDLKPANVMVTPEGQVKVLDFGLAKAVYGQEEEGPTQLGTVTVVDSVTGHVIGTPAYMSPEQARGERVDQRSDIWSFGCLLYELLTGQRIFRAGTLQETITAVLEREPDWRLLPAKTPARVRQLLQRCLQKDVKQRLPAIADARKTIEATQRGWNRRHVAGVSALVLALAAVAAFWLKPPARLTDSSQWVQLTKFSDSVTQPALSPDGRMVAFIRGESTFYGPGQIYVKVLPDGSPVQLTRDNLDKMSPVFSPDGTRIAYTTVDPDFQWDTWTVPVVGGGEPQMMLKNASGLVWTGPRQVMFSEIRMGVHMSVVTSEESRLGQRDVYVPPNEPDMAHRSYQSPDGKWVLLVEMDIDHLWEPCRLVPADGSSPGHKVGPLGGGCTFAAWSPDGKWMYFTSNAVSANHIWRQRFPDGKPEQITAGPTEEEGIAMAPDGRSFVTAVSLQGASLWLHDASGDRQISIEGNAAAPVFTADGSKLLYRVVREQPNEFAYYRDLGEVMVADLKSGRSEPLALSFPVLNFDISPDGRQVVMEAPDAAGRSRLWLAPLDRSAPLRQIPNLEGGAPHFGPDGEIIFRHNEGASTPDGSLGLIYRVLPDGTGLRKASEQPVSIFNFPKPISLDGRWVFGLGPLPGDGPAAGQVYSLDGKPPITVGANGQVSWGAGGALLSYYAAPEAFYFPLAAGQILPRIPAGGFRSSEEIGRLPGARRIEGRLVTLGPTPDVYAYYRGNTQRNLYRIPVP
jgi:serine/threonine protein kinase/Tol biopolymer transport system component